MNRDFVIRSIVRSELDDLLELYTHHLFSTPDAPLPPRTEVQSLWDDIFDNQMLHYFVVEYEGRVVSTCTLTIIPNLTRGARPYGLIENVVTHKDFRGRGLGKSLLKYTLNFAWQKNCYKVMLLSSSRRQAAHRLYESVGFSKDEKIGYVAKP